MKDVEKKAEKLVEQMKDTFRGASASMAHARIGEMVLQLLEREEPVTAPSLIAAFEAVAEREKALGRSFAVIEAEEAIKRLRALAPR